MAIPEFECGEFEVDVLDTGVQHRAPVLRAFVEPLEIAAAVQMKVVDSELVCTECRSLQRFNGDFDGGGTGDEI